MIKNNNKKEIYYHNKGKRKTSIALVYIKKCNNNKNKILINNKNINNYFNNNKICKNKILFPLNITNNLKKFNILIKVKGGGYTGQSEAICLAISRILKIIDKNNLKILKKYKLLTRDSRKVERKKYGRKKSRKKFQFSKR